VWTDAPVCMCERGTLGECWCTCYSTVRCTIVNGSCRIRRLGAVSFVSTCEDRKKGEPRRKCHTQKHKCQFHHSISEPVELFVLLGRRPDSSDATSLQSRPRTSIVLYFARLHLGVMSHHNGYSCKILTTVSQDIFVVYHEEIKTDLNRILKYEYRCDERLRVKTVGSTLTRLTYTRLCGGLEHLT
jgi:hypothetical protein